MVTGLSGAKRGKLQSFPIIPSKFSNLLGTVRALVLTLAWNYLKTFAEVAFGVDAETCTQSATKKNSESVRGSSMPYQKGHDFGTWVTLAFSNGWSQLEPIPTCWGNFYPRLLEIALAFYWRLSQSLQEADCWYIRPTRWPLMWEGPCTCPHRVVIGF